MAKFKDVETITHDDKRTNIPTAEYQPLVREEDAAPVEVAYERRSPDLDPQLVWRGKDLKNWSDLVVRASPLYIQEKVHPKVLIDDLRRRTEAREEDQDIDEPEQMNLFDDFNGVREGDAKTEFYEHEANWSNRMILGDALQVMASLAEREGLRGKVQCIYLDPPYGIDFKSNFQWSTHTRDVRDGKTEHITREPEQVKAFRDTWRDGIHSYLTYLRDRLTVCRDLLKDSGSIFVQIGDENVHLVRSLMDEVLGEANFVSQITFTKTESFSGNSFSNVTDFILWYAKDEEKLKYRDIKFEKVPGESGATGYVLLENEERSYWRRATKEEVRAGSVEGFTFFDDQPLVSQDEMEGGAKPFEFRGETYTPPRGRHWTTGKDMSKMRRVKRANRLIQRGNRIEWKRYIDEVAGTPLNNVWLGMGDRGFTGEKKIYVVQTAPEVVRRCIIMSTDPGDLVFDPTCGSGTTAHVAEQWGRRWITADTSRVALALARARLMGARYPYYLLKDSEKGKEKEAEIAREPVSDTATANNIRQGFVYKRAPHITLGEIANNAGIDVIYDRYEEEMGPILERINEKTGRELEEWQIHRVPGVKWPKRARKQHKRFMRVTTDATRQKAVNRVNEVMDRDYTIDTFPKKPVDLWEDEKLIDLHEKWWDLRIERQKEIDASIAAAADFEYLYDQPYEDDSKVRVAGPFTVESLSPHRTLGVDENGDVIDKVAEARNGYGGQDYPSLILDALGKSGVQQTHKDDRIELEQIETWPGEYICATGTYIEENTGDEQHAGIFIGPEFGSVTRPSLVSAAREAADAGLDALIACGFNFDAHASDFEKLGRVNVLKARMNADLHMASDLANTGSGNLFVVFGEPDIDIVDAGDDQIQVEINGVDVFDPSSGEVRSDDTDGIACWFVDTDYNEESFFVRHAYFLGTNDPYNSLKKTLKAEVDQEAWDSLYSDTSRPFTPPESGRIAVKVINHLGDEVMQVLQVDH